jgi:hypothetical protein
MEQKISIEVAEKEWISFLTDNDAQGLIPDEKQKSSKIKEDRDDYQNKKVGFDRVVRAISSGLIIIDNGIITQTLREPIKDQNSGANVIDKLVYNGRWTVSDREEIFKNIDTKDSGEVFEAQRRLAAKITGQNMLVLKKIDSVDFKLMDQIVSVFFM